MASKRWEWRRGKKVYIYRIPAGWQLEDAFSISADGLSIVGRANNPDGNNEAFLLRLDSAPIPEPGTGLLVSFGLLVLAARRCR